MDFNGTVEIDAPRAAVWALLLDFEQLATCGPGVQSIEQLDPTHARVKAKIGVAFMTLGFTIDLELVEVEAPDRAVIRATGAASGNQVEATGPHAPDRTRGGPDDDDLRGDRRAVRVAGWRGFADDRGHGRQAPRPDLRLRPGAARAGRAEPQPGGGAAPGHRRARDERPRPRRRADRARRSRSTPRSRRSSGSAASWTPAAGRSS